MSSNNINTIAILVSIFSISNGCIFPRLQTNPHLNLTEYTRKTWYIQEQQINGYQSQDSLFCVTATYNMSNDHVPFFNNTVISVFNYANMDSVNGYPIGNNTKLCARLKNNSEPEKLSVAPCFLPNIFAGPYWIVEVGPYSYNYDWAVVIGGQPSINVTNTTCTTKTYGVNGAGLWIFSRNKTMDSNVLSSVKYRMEHNGISTKYLINVKQQGCNYTGAYIK